MTPGNQDLILSPTLQDSNRLLWRLWLFSQPCCCFTWRPWGHNVRRFFFEHRPSQTAQQASTQQVRGLLTLWSEEDRTWVESVRAPNPGSRGQAGLWGSSDSNTGRSRTARQLLRPASPHQKRPGAQRSPAWHSSWSGEQRHRKWGGVEPTH